MQIYADRELRSIFERCEGGRHTEFRFERCSFVNCNIGIPNRVDGRPIVERAVLIDCAASNVSLGAAVVRDAIVQGLRVRGECTAFGTLFERVVLRGRLGSFRVRPLVRHGDRGVVAAFAADNRLRYEQVDWALDITELLAQEAEFQGVPSALVRRDPATQVVVRREKAIQAFGGWPSDPIERARRSNSLDDRIGRGRGAWAAALTIMLDEGADDVVLAAPRGASKRVFQGEMDGLRALVDMGIAEP